MTVLGLETSTAVCSVGLCREGADDLEISIRESHIHSEKLLTLVRECLDRSGMVLNRLDAIAVSIGPGSFTGLRIGLSTAKGLCYALGKPVLAVPTFAAIAEAARLHHPDAKLISVVIDAKKDEWYVGQLRISEGKAREVSPVEVLDADRALERAGREPSLVFTDKPDLLRSRLDARAVVHDVHDYCKGNIIARLGIQKAAQGEFADAADLEPLYLKDFIVRSVAPSSP